MFMRGSWRRWRELSLTKRAISRSYWMKKTRSRELRSAVSTAWSTSGCSCDASAGAGAGVGSFSVCVCGCSGWVIVYLLMQGKCGC